MTISMFLFFIVSLKKVVEEAIVCRCCCRSFGMRATKLAIAHEGNMLLVVNSAELGSALHRKHTSSPSISYFCRERYANEIVQIRHVKSKSNLVDRLTKGLDSSDFNDCFLPLVRNQFGSEECGENNFQRVDSLYFQRTCDRQGIIVYDSGAVAAWFAGMVASIIEHRCCYARQCLRGTDFLKCSCSDSFSNILMSCACLTIKNCL